MDKRSLYGILATACAAGYIWLGFSMVKPANAAVNVCLFKRITGIPCPSCGSTRAVQALVGGNFIESLNINPFGVIIATVMLVVPVWILMDSITRKQTLLTAYRQTEKMLRQPPVAIVLIALVLLNWIWNITKEL